MPALFRMPEKGTIDPRLTAFLERDAAFDGALWAGVRTTGIYCRPTCTAKKPRPENVVLFDSLDAARRAGFRACLRCHPDEAAEPVPAWARELLASIEREPLRRRTSADLQRLGVEPRRARRWFQARFGVTFAAFARTRRLALAQRVLAQVPRGRSSARVAAVATASGFESESGFRAAFAKLYGAPPKRAAAGAALYVARIATPLGTLVAAATDAAVCFVEFADRRGLAGQVRALRAHFELPIVPGSNARLAELKRELGEYFAGTRRAFDVPVAAPGTPFQRRVWDALRAIPYGETRSYAEIARAAGSPHAIRAAGRANGMNRLAILLPCHRVIGADGALVGYAGGTRRKQWLLEHEQRDARAR
ncbi:MAG: bifunctional transcriptional activator/DNA repair protein Ada [Planctomycetota bacterium]|nr:MAG: bifunctional transcriptional activator/DNA repair protein Ada [Planctomycetota bacterium]